MRKLVGSLIIATLAAMIALAIRVTPGTSMAMTSLDDLFYDVFYKLRTPVLKNDASVAVVAVDDSDIGVMIAYNGRKFPWPREFWGRAAKYFETCGAQAVVIDLQFDEPSQYNNEGPDDETFAELLSEMKIPVVLAVKVKDRQPEKLVVPIGGNVKIGSVTREESMLREHIAHPGGGETRSLALAAMEASGRPIPVWAERASFRLHFYGPVTRDDQRNTLPYFHAVPICLSALPAAADDERRQQILARFSAPNSNDFKDRIVVIGAVAAGAHDNFTSPLEGKYAGVDSHATAIENMTRGDYVHIVHSGFQSLITAAAAFAVAFGAIWPRLASLKVMLAASATILLIAGSVIAFRGQAIHWLPMSMPLMGCVLAVVGALARSYLTEDRQRQFMTQALGQYVSPEVTRTLERNPAQLKLQAEQRFMTALFSDVAGFTDLSEQMSAVVLSRVLNLYMDRMSEAVLREGGTIDKYIGDAIMAFWNAPLAQADHAARACRTALAMREAENGIRRELLSDAGVQQEMSSNQMVKQWIDGMGTTSLYTRFGVNSGDMNVGNMGSRTKFQYTVIGDAVNAAARLEPANKRYGTRILISDSTARLLDGEFLLRRVDVLRVKGKTKPMQVFELIGRGQPDQQMTRRLEMFARAFELYQQSQWQASKNLLIEICRMIGEDGPARCLLKRIDLYEMTPPPQDWAGVFVAEDK